MPMCGGFHIDAASAGCSVCIESMKVVEGFFPFAQALRCYAS